MTSALHDRRATLYAKTGMTRWNAATSREAKIEEFMRTTNLMRPEATALVARRHGEYVSDIAGPRDRPLTEVERRRLGLGRSIWDAVHAGRANASDNRDVPVKAVPDTAS